MWGLGGVWQDQVQTQWAQVGAQDHTLWRWGQDREECQVLAFRRHRAHAYLLEPHGVLVTAEPQMGPVPVPSDFLMVSSTSAWLMV